ncbi:MAG: histidine--tRNA ligase [Acidilobus sp.]
MVELRPPRGFRDVPPELAILRKDLISRLEAVYRRYGFDPLETPAVEHWEVLAGKYGEEAEGRLIWRFKDPWSDREYALRYDLTVPLARFVASHPEMPMPFKRYQIAPVWRHDEPQKGRYREFYQADADIVGSPYPEADAEVINLLMDALEALGISSGYRVLINDRRILAGIFEVELSLSNPLAVYRAIDRLDKVGEQGVRAELEGLLGPSAASKVMELISLRGDVADIADRLLREHGSNKAVAEGAGHLKEVAGLVKRPSVLAFDMSLVRGLDYYTGPILEVVLDRPKIGSVAGGGRYDNLIALFAKRSVPATGVSIGIDRLIDAGIEVGLFSTSRRTYTQVVVVNVRPESYRYAWKVADSLRSWGFSVRVDLNRSGQDEQRRKASRLEVPLLAFIGPQEEASGTVTLFSPSRGERVTVKLEEAREAVERLLL